MQYAQDMLASPVVVSTVLNPQLKPFVAGKPAKLVCLTLVGVTILPSQELEEISEVNTINLLLLPC